MNDDRSPIDDELLSAVLDGEATAEERGRVEASPEALARLEQLRSAAARVAEPVAPLDADVAERLLARAVDEVPPATTRGDDLPIGPGRRHDLAGRRRWRSWGGALAGVAAAILLVVVGVGLARVGSRTASDASSGASASATANESAAADAAAPVDGGSSTATALAELGQLPDATTVLARFAVLEAAATDFDHQFDPSSPDSRSAELSQSLPDADLAAPSTATACPVPPVTPAPDESWAAAAVAELPTGPVVVMVDRAGGTGARVLVVDAATCAVLAEGTT